MTPDIPQGSRPLTDDELLRLPDDSMFFHEQDGQWHPTMTPRQSATPGLSYCRPIQAMKSPIPDSGARTAFNTGAVRDAAEGKGLPSRIPPIALHALAVRFEDGSIKYPDDKEFGPNWMQGIPLSRFYDAVTRHSQKAAMGHTDEDHFGAILWNAAAWLWTHNEIEAGRLPAELNDLPFHPRGIFERNRKTHTTPHQHAKD